jgi:hypothetical protein
MGKVLDAVKKALAEEELFQSGEGSTKKDRRQVITKTVSIPAATAIRGTGKAILCRIPTKASVFEAWVPRSQIAEGSEVEDVGEYGVLVVSEWWYHTSKTARQFGDNIPPVSVQGEKPVTIADSDYLGRDRTYYVQDDRNGTFSIWETSDGGWAVVAESIGDQALAEEIVRHLSVLNSMCSALRARHAELDERRRTPC